MTYRIFARVSGGVTGTRESYVKSGGEVLEFDNFETADKYAKTLMSKTQNDPYRTCNFFYEAVSY